MRDIPGRTVSVNGRSVYVEETGAGQDWVVFEAGMSCGRTCWDPVLPLLADRARLVAYDRAGRALSGSATRPLSVDDMAADLVAMIEAVVPGTFVLVAHSMGGLIARRAAESLEHRLQGLLLVDPTPETAPMYDTWDRTAQKIDHNLAVAQALTHVHPLARLGARNIRGLFPKATYQTMLT
jgi:pimeloyl-ACP methyl ester carboxylesterase